MKVLSFVSSISLRNGGPSRSVPMLMKGLSELGEDVTLMTVRTEDMNTEALDGTSVKLKLIDRNWIGKDVERYVAAERFDLIQLQTIWEYSYHQLAHIARKLGISYIITPRGMLEPWILSQRPWKKKLALWLYQRKDLEQAACIYATSQLETDNIRRLGIQTPISVIPNGIDTDDYPCRTSSENVKKQVLFLSRIHAKKGIELLIDAWKQVTEAFPEWHLRIVGNGESGYVATLRSRIAERGLSESVSIEEPVYGEKKIRLYQESALFCLPSYSENFGMAIAEALSCGVPVITTKNCPWQILNETRTGWCINQDVETLSQTLQKAMEKDASALFDMGQKGSQVVKSYCDYRNVAKQTLTLYRKITNKEK